jgi:hypothetical protein
MSIKKMYYYLFYKIYKLSEAAPSRWLSDWKAGIAIVALEIWLLLSIGVYYTVVTKVRIQLNIKMPIIFVPFLAILLGNYLLFFANDRWKEYAQEFDQWPKAKNRLGSLIVFSLIILIIINLFFSFYLMSQVNWSQYN